MTDWTVNTILVAWFITYMLHQKFNIVYRIKRLLRIKLTRSVKVLDCYPCFSFWITLIGTLNPIIALSVFLIATIIDRK